MSQALCRLESDGAENRVVYLGPFQRGEPNEAREFLSKVDQVARVEMKTPKASLKQSGQRKCP